MTARVSCCHVLFVLALCVGSAAVTFADSPDADAPVRVGRLRVEYRENPLGIDVRAPRLSWQIASGDRDVRQAAYQVQVATSDAELRAGRGLAWDTGRVESRESVHRPYEGAALRSRQRYTWRVRVWDARGRASAWSEPAWWEMGLLGRADWTARWIEPPAAPAGSTPMPLPLLRRAFRVARAVRSARVYVTSRGMYEIHLNGRRVGEDVLTPGWTSYDHRLQYQVYDVTGSVRRGDNVLGVLLGDGWYRSGLGFSEPRRRYGDRLALLLQLELTYADGTRGVIASDAQWRAAPGPILEAGIYEGEAYDARLERAGWTSPGFDDHDWSAVALAEWPFDTLVAQAGPPVRRIQEVTPVEVRTAPSGTQIVDLGQNMVGWVRLRVDGPAGTTVTLRHAEVLDAQGELYTANLRHAKQTVRYTLRGGGPETYEPHFTFQGFRYVAVDGYPGPLTTSALTGVVVHSAMAGTGRFTATNPQLMQLQHNITWGQKGNFIDVPTDCPQRDERLGWTGDAQVFAATAAFNMDVAAFFTKWLRDVAADQLPTGSVPWVVPDVLSTAARPAAGSAGWGDAAVVIPWALYRAYGDRRVLEEQYDSMARWVGFMRDRAGDDAIWDGDFHFGDWLAFATTRSDYPGATTSKDLIATAYLAHGSDLMARIARVLGKPNDAARYAAQCERVRAAWVREFVTPAGRVGEDTQTAYVLALAFDLLPPELRANAADRLAREVRTRGHLTTGFLGTPGLLHVLSASGHLDEAYSLLERRDYPSWLYPITKGATTIWERWDGIKPDGSFQDPDMNSFNHYAYGAVGEWMYRVVAGLDLDEAAPGYRHVIVHPRPGGSLTSAGARHESMYGPVESSWRLADGRLELEVEIPPNATGTVRLPRAAVADVTEGGLGLAGVDGVRSSRQDGEDVVVEVGSGRYRFESRWRVARSGSQTEN